MRESGYYPAGAEYDPRAPWNEPEPTELDYNVEVEVWHDDTDDEEEGGHAEKKTLTVTIDVYGYDEDGYDPDEVRDGVYDAVRDELGKTEYEILDYWEA